MAVMNAGVTKEPQHVCARIKITNVQVPMVTTRCSHRVGSKRCMYHVTDGQCSRGHSTAEQPPYMHLVFKISFVDADMERSVQHHVFLRPSAIAELTGMCVGEILQLSVGFQEQIAKEMVGNIYKTYVIIAIGYNSITSFKGRSQKC